eukprot:323597-Chlamydomonas_euryale.AAC.3
MPYCPSQVHESTWNVHPNPCIHPIDPPPNPSRVDSPRAGQPRGAPPPRVRRSSEAPTLQQLITLREDRATHARWQSSRERAAAAAAGCRAPVIGMSVRMQPRIWVAARTASAQQRKREARQSNIRRHCQLMVSSCLAECLACVCAVCGCEPWGRRVPRAGTGEVGRG